MGVDEESLDSMIRLGNSFANEIIVYLQKYIDEDLRNEIKLQYRKDLMSPTYDSLFKETDIIFDLDFKNKLLLKMLYDVLKEVSTNGEAIKELESIKEGIELS